MLFEEFRLGVLHADAEAGSFKQDSGNALSDEEKKELIKLLDDSEQFISGYYNKVIEQVSSTLEVMDRIDQKDAPELYQSMESLLKQVDEMLVELDESHTKLLSVLEGYDAEIEERFNNMWSIILSHTTHLTDIVNTNLRRIIDMEIPPSEVQERLKKTRMKKSSGTKAVGKDMSNKFLYR